MNTQQAVQRIAKIPPKKLALAAAKKRIAMLEDELRNRSDDARKLNAVQQELADTKQGATNLRARLDQAEASKPFLARLRALFSP